jgi:hypothetical protein
MLLKKEYFLNINIKMFFVIFLPSIHCEMVLQLTIHVLYFTCLWLVCTSSVSLLNNP